MYTMNLFEKKEAMNVNEYNELLTLLTNHGFKVSSALEKNVNECARIVRNGGELTRKKDYIVAWVGDTYHGNLMSVWSSHTKKGVSARYTVRISKKLLDTIYNISDACKIALQSFKNEDSNELSRYFMNINDVTWFFDTLFAYISTAQQTKEATKNSEVKTA